MEIRDYNDRQLADGFKKHYTRGAIGFIVGALGSMIIIGIPVLIYGFKELYTSQKIKKEIQRRVKTEGYNPYGQMVHA